MTTSTETLVRRFWSHVFERPQATAMMVKNLCSKETMFFTGLADPTTASVVAAKQPPYRKLNWQTVGYLVAEMMIFLQKMEVSRGSKVAILAWNSPEWVWADLAIQSLGAVTVPIYPNSSPEQVNFILKDSDSILLLANSEEQAAKVDASAQIPVALFSSALCAAPDYQACEHEDIHIGGAVINPDALNLPARLRVQEIMLDYMVNAEKFLGITGDDIATLVYSSGSTGIPKGVIIQHRNIAGFCPSLMRHGFAFKSDDFYLGYLPLAHIYERLNGTYLCLWHAVPSAYCSVEEMAETAKTLKPTILLGVPKVWRKIRDSVTHELDKTINWRSAHKDWAWHKRMIASLKAPIVAWSLKQYDHGIKRWIADKIVFKRIRGELGGRVRLMLSGGAAIPPDVLKFFQLMGWTLLEGYGATETCGGIVVNTPENNKPGSLGKPIDCVELKIVPKEGLEEGVGVIFVRGDCITSGYWKRDEENAKSFDSEGYFNTGDLGKFDADGYLHYKGRVKRLNKNDGGKYWATEKIENAFEGYKDGDLIQYVVPVGDNMPFVGALFFLNLAKARKLVGATPSGQNDAAYYATHPTILKAVAAIVEHVNVGLEQHETVKQFEIVPVEATVDNGLLTNKLSIRSEEAMKRYAALIDAIFARKK